MPRKKADSQAKYPLTRNLKYSKVAEAALVYLVEEAPAMPDTAITTISSKNQITLPVSLVRALGLEAGDKLTVQLEDQRIVLKPRPKDWVTYYGGALAGYYGKTKKEVDAYLAEVRGDWGTYL